MYSYVGGYPLTFWELSLQFPPRFVQHSALDKDVLCGQICHPALAWGGLGKSQAIRFGSVGVYTQNRCCLLVGQLVILCRGADFACSPWQLNFPFPAQDPFRLCCHPVFCYAGKVAFPVVLCILGAHLR